MMGIKKAGVRQSAQGEFVMTRAQMKQMRMDVREMRVGRDEDRWAPIIPLNHPEMRTNAKRIDMSELEGMSTPTDWKDWRSKGMHVFP